MGTVPLTRLVAQKAADISYNEKSQRATFSFEDEITASGKVSLEVEFTGIMNDNMAGFYRSKYRPAVTPSKSVPMEGENHLMFSTQFESCDARTAFPCLDEPNLKASFDFSLEIPEDLVALSNMPETGTKESKKGFKVVSFERSPVMSTYVSNPAYTHLVRLLFEDKRIQHSLSSRQQYQHRHVPSSTYT